MCYVRRVRKKDNLRLAEEAKKRHEVHNAMIDAERERLAPKGQYTYS